MLQAEPYDEIKTSLMDIGHNYILNVRQWGPNSYNLRVAEKVDDTVYVLSAFKLEDRQARRDLMKKLNGAISGAYPSEFRMIVNLDKKAVIEDIRPGDKDRHPRP